MTKEEAIVWFKNSPFYNENHEPFNMAISALSEEETLKSQLANCHKEILRLLDLNMLTEDENDVVETDDEVIDHDREWIIGCIKHDGFIKTDRFDKANQIILEALEQTEPSDLISRADAMAYPLGFDHYDKENGSREFICGVESYREYIQHLPSVSAEPTFTEEVREALMRLTMCAREECGMCKYKDDCDFDKQYEMATDNMHTILNAFKCVSAERSGEWLQEEHKDYKCSVCGEEQWDDTDYCPNCGARMENKK